ncbi:MAG: hypothetical protein JW829_12315 [Pirellulales bacterium]|nr:hypothetical protein [Pirellulales bacterium]
MGKNRWFGMCIAASLLGGTVNADITFTTAHDSDPYGFDSQILSDDVLANLIPTELPGDNGWHPVNLDPADRLPAFTDGAGALSILTGLLNDFPNDVENVPPADEEDPTKLIQYELESPTNIERIHILTGNANVNTPDGGVNGRVFSTTAIQYSTDGGLNFDLLGYFESDPLGTVNSNDGLPGRLVANATLVEIFDDTTTTMVQGVTHLQFLFYSVSNTQGQYRDPYDGVNPFTGVDDMLEPAFESPLVWEIDVIGQMGMNPADFNDDGFVDDADLAKWKSGFGMLAGAAKGDGDADLDGDVDGSDYLIWQVNFGAIGAGLSTAAIPEPVSWGLGLLGMFAALPFFCHSRPRRR